ncbi:MAG TPA: PqqD family protein [Candidatus Binataceae bacterium]|nr:PqqD family protein [Candidatus Binataceae bacterium]
MNDTYIKRHADTAARMLGDEMIVMSVKDSRVFTLNPTASVIWRAADGATSLREIVERAVVAEFEIDAESAYRDALELVGKLAQEGILVVAGEPVAADQS